jgi:pilus assembly protein Flp/PilA
MVPIQGPDLQASANAKAAPIRLAVNTNPIARLRKVPPIVCSNIPFSPPDACGIIEQGAAARRGEMLASTQRQRLPLTRNLRALAALPEDKAEESGALGRAAWFIRGWGMRRFTEILRCEKGANAIEYALVASLIAIAAVAAMANLGTKVDTMFSNVSNNL